MNKIQLLEPDTISKLQKYIAAKNTQRGFDDETLQDRLLLLAEEVGELINSCRKLTGIKIDKNRRITNKAGEEVVDAINMVFNVANKLGIDVEKEFVKKEKIIDRRRYVRLNRVRK